MNRRITLATIVGILSVNGAVFAGDARSIAVGGAVIANGKGVSGATSNPASMMSMQRRGETEHLLMGLSGEFRDTGDVTETLIDEDNENLISDIEEEIDRLSNTPIECDLQDGDADCVTGTQELSDLAGRVLDIMNLVDGETIDGFANADFGIANTGSKVPFAINFRMSAAGSGTSDIADDDRAYIAELGTLLDDDGVTLNEIMNSEFLFIEEGDLLGIQQPEDVLESSGFGGVLIRTQLSVSLATSLQVGSQSVDVGVTPKISRLRVRSLMGNARDEFISGALSIEDRIDNSEVSENSFTADVGASMMLKNSPVAIATVIRNMIPESVKTNDGYEFETTPQLILGGSYQNGLFSMSADVALNEAKQDNFSTQKMGIGIEFGSNELALRGGVAHDAARVTDPTSLTLGFRFGPIDVGARVTGLESLEVGAQLSFTL